MIILRDKSFSWLFPKTSTSRNNSDVDINNIKLPPEYKKLVNITNDPKLRRLIDNSVITSELDGNIPTFDISDENDIKTDLELGLDGNKAEIITIGDDEGIYYDFLLNSWIVNGKRSNFIRVKKVMIDALERDRKLWIDDGGSSEKDKEDLNKVVDYEIDLINRKL